MGSAFIYMYFVGLGCSLGVATTALLGYLYVRRTQRKQQMRKRRV